MGKWSDFVERRRKKREEKKQARGNQLISETKSLLLQLFNKDLVEMLDYTFTVYDEVHFGDRERRLQGCYAPVHSDGYYSHHDIWSLSIFCPHCHEDIELPPCSKRFDERAHIFKCECKKHIPELIKGLFND